MYFGPDAFSRSLNTRDPYRGGRRVIPYLSHGMGVKVNRSGRPVPGRPQTPRPNGNGAGADRAGEQQQQPPTLQQPQKPPTQQTANPYDYSADPILQKVISGQDSLLADSRSHMLDEQKRVLLGFGSKQLAQQFLGADPFVESVSSDPARSTSVLARLAEDFSRRERGLNESLNNENLFYSGTRADELGQLNRSQVLAETDATKNVHDLLAQIMQRYLDAKRQSNESKMAAEEAAYMRAIQMAQSGSMEQPTANSAGSFIEGAPADTGFVSNQPLNILQEAAAPERAAQLAALRAFLQGQAGVGGAAARTFAL